MILKICGITNPDDAAAAIEAGATAIGFNFFARSPRYVAPERAAAIRTPAGVRRVGVFVNEAPERVEEIARLAALDVAQLHGDESAADFPRQATDASASFSLPPLAVWKALRVGPDFHFQSYAACPAEALLLDGPAGALYGGAGRAFDWALAAAANRRIILAGGLDASNVKAAVELAHPWGVDACSKIESAPGIKDHRKMIEFLQAARAALNA